MINKYLGLILVELTTAGLALVALDPFDAVQSAGGAKGFAKSDLSQGAGAGAAASGNQRIKRRQTAIESLAVAAREPGKPKPIPFTAEDPAQTAPKDEDVSLREAMKRWGLLADNSATGFYACLEQVTSVSDYREATSIETLEYKTISSVELRHQLRKLKDCWEQTIVPGDATQIKGMGQLEKLKERLAAIDADDRANSGTRHPFAEPLVAVIDTRLTYLMVKGPIRKVELELIDKISDALTFLERMPPDDSKYEAWTGALRKHVEEGEGPPSAIAQYVVSRCKFRRQALDLKARYKPSTADQLQGEIHRFLKDWREPPHQEEGGLYQDLRDRRH
jgi:hypothetical protein